MTTELRALIEDASAMAEAIFEPVGQSLAHILAIGPDGKRHLVACPMADADEERMFRIFVPRQLKARGFQRWVFFCEAWRAEYPAGGEGPEDAPPKTRPDRMEIFTFAAESADGTILMAERQIYRPVPDAPGRLMPLVFSSKPGAFVMGDRK